MSWLLVSIGGAAGALLRYKISLRMAAVSQRYPWATFAINISGSILLGALTGWRDQLPSLWYLLLGVGFCGAYTTFSTFTVEVLQLLQQSRFKLALRYGAFSAMTCIGGAGLGLYVASL